MYVLEWCIHESIYVCIYWRAVTDFTTHVPAEESLRTRMVHSRVSVDDERGRGHHDVLWATYICMYVSMYVYSGEP